MSGPTTPNGFGEFQTGAMPGEGTGENETTAQTDWMIGPLQSSLGYPRIAWRMRYAGFDHGMPVQDALDSVGGVQLNGSHGGVRWYGIANGAEPWRQVAIAGAPESGNDESACSVQMFAAYKRDLAASSPDQVTYLADDENAYGFLSGWKNVLLIKGNGDLVSPLAHRTWTPALASGHALGEVYGAYTKILNRVLFNGLAAIQPNTSSEPLRLTLPLASGGPTAGGGRVIATNSGRWDGLLVANTAAHFSLYGNDGNQATEQQYSGKWFYFEGQYFTT